MCCLFVVVAVGWLVGWLLLLYCCYAAVVLHGVMKGKQSLENRTTGAPASQRGGNSGRHALTEPDEAGIVHIIDVQGKQREVRAVSMVPTTTTFFQCSRKL